MTQHHRLNWNTLTPLARCLIGIVLTAQTVWATDAPRTASPPFERWYVVTLAGQRVGWSHLQVTADQQADRIRTSSQTQFTIRRGQHAMTVTLKTQFDETGSGQPIEATSQQDLGMMAVSQIFIFKPDGIEMISRQGTQEQRQILPPPQVPGGQRWLPPAAMQRHVQEQINRGARDIRGWTLDPSIGIKPIQVHMQRTGQEDVQVFGKVVPATVWAVTTSAVPGMVTTQYADARGQTVKSAVTFLPGMPLTLIEADEQLATSPVDPPQLLRATLIHPDQPIHQPRQARSAVYELTLTRQSHTPHPSQTNTPPPGGSGSPASPPSTQPRAQSDHGLQAPQAGHQRVERLNASSVRVRVDLNTPVDASHDRPTQDHRVATTMLNAEDAQIQGLVTRALALLPNDAPVLDRVEALRGFVHGYIQAKDLSVGFATASEVARTRQGDCTEHAVLLAAMLRAAGIPSRTVSGLIYVDEFLGQSGVFGYHMWTQAWVPMQPADHPPDQPSGQAPKPDAARGYWLDLDATLADQRFDATHIALVTSAMSQQAAMNDMVALAPTIGWLQIKVVSVE